MESVKLHIAGLGLIRNTDIEIAPMMVFSGESGLGKSYVAILYHYFFHVWLNPKRLDAFFKELQSSRDINFFNTANPHADNGAALEITKKELEKWLAKDAVAYLQYMLGHDGLSAELTVSLPDIIPDHIAFMYEQELMGLNNAEDLYHKLTVLHVTYKFRQLGIQDESPYAYVLRYAMADEIFGGIQKLDYSFVLPPSRGSYMSEEVVGRTGLYRSFIQGMRELEQVQEVSDCISEQLVELCRKVMDGEVKKAGDKYVYITHGETLPISAAASSIKETASLQLMISKRDISKASILIEEPEAHLHPLKQRMMADVIATMSMGNANMQITTHSDYFIRRINDLMHLHILKGKMSNDDYAAFCKKNDLKLDCDSVILFERNGQKYLLLCELKSSYICEDIAHAKDRLIGSNVKMKSLSSLLQGFDKSQFKVIGLIISFEPTEEQKTNISKKEDRKSYFALTLQAKRKYVMPVVKTNRFFHPLDVGESHLYYIGVPDRQTTYTVDMNAVLEL